MRKPGWRQRAVSRILALVTKRKKKVASEAGKWHARPPRNPDPGLRHVLEKAQFSSRIVGGGKKHMVVWTALYQGITTQSGTKKEAAARLRRAIINQGRG